ncbi:hypothetical protein ABBQ38_007492 [Trebouxia sp. C0009 RCD-2024]
MTIHCAPATRPAHAVMLQSTSSGLYPWQILVQLVTMEATAWQLKTLCNMYTDKAQYIYRLAVYGPS